MLLIACNRIKPSETLIHRIESTDCHCFRRSTSVCVSVGCLRWFGQALRFDGVALSFFTTRASRFAGAHGIGMLAGSPSVQFKASEKYVILLFIAHSRAASNCHRT